MSGPVRPPLTVETVDGLTSGRPITKIKVSNGDLTISGNTATIDTTGSGGTPGGSDTEIQFNNAGAFGGDAGLKITTKGGGGTTTIRSGNMLLGGGKVATATANGFVTLQADGSGQIFLTSGADQGGTFTDTQVNIFSNSNTDNAILNFRDSSNIENGRITLKDDGNLEIKNSVSGKNVFLEVAGSAGVTVKQATTDTDVQLTVEGNGTGTPKLALTNNTKAVTVLCDTNEKLKVEGGTDSFVFDVSSASGGITFPDGTTQTTAASGVSFPLTAPDGSKTAPSYSFSNDTDTGIFLVSAGNLAIAVGGEREIKFKPNELQLDGGGPSQYKITTDNANTNIIIQPNTGEASIEVEAGGASQNVKISGANGGTVSFNGNYNFPVSDGSANQVLQTDGAGSLSFADASGVSFPLEAPDGSAAAPSYTFSSDTDTGIFRENADTISFTVGGTRKIQFTTDGIKLVSGQVQAEGTTLSSGGGYTFAADTDTGMEKYFANFLTLRTAGSPRFTIGSSGEIRIGGTTSGNDGDAGTSGQVLTSAGASSPPTWETPSGGGGSSTNGTPQITGKWTSSDGSMNSFTPGAVFAIDQDIESFANAGFYCIPFIAPVSGTVDAFGIRPFAAVSTGANPQAGIYDSTAAGLPYQLQVSCDFGSSAAKIIQTTLTGSLNVVAGTQYWLGFITNGSQNYYTTNMGLSGANLTAWPELDMNDASIAFNEFGNIPLVETGLTSLPSEVTLSNLERNIENGEDFPTIKYRIS